MNFLSTLCYALRYKGHSNIKTVVSETHYIFLKVREHNFSALLQFSSTYLFKQSAVSDCG